MKKSRATANDFFSLLFFWWAANLVESALDYAAVKSKKTSTHIEARPA